MNLKFLTEWLKDPLKTASIIPSSKSLAKLITSEITPQTGPILELGPGTGIFTQQILDIGVPPENLILLEINQQFCDVLQKRFPSVRVLNCDAATFSREDINIKEPFGAVVSGLGILSMPEELTKSILQNCFSNMANDAWFYQFTYNWRTSIPLHIMDELGLVHQRVGGTLLNFPPANVFKYQKKKP